MTETPKSVPALEVGELTGGYGKVPILHGASLQVFDHEVVGILGHNGMGKSTLLRLLMGLLPATSGVIRYRGRAITALPPFERARLGIGFVPQERGIFPQLTVRDNLRFGWQGFVSEHEGDVLDAVLDAFPRLADLLNRRGSTLSGGEQQLLALARCLMGEPDFLLLDEPTEGIQPSIIDEIAETLRRLQERSALSILLVEQNFDFVAALCDRVLILERGRVTGELGPADLANPAEIETLLGLGPVRSASSSSPSSRPGPPGNLSPVERVAAPLHGSVPKERAASPPAADAGRFPGTANNMTVNRPSLAQMRTMADQFGMGLTDHELEQYREVMEPYVQAYDRLDAAPDHLPPVRYPRAPGHFPDPSDNQLNAWYVKTDVRGAADGPLRGKRIVLKDTVCLAGVPMMNGSAIMEGYTPEVDATIVTRMLDAGATIVGKAHCENFCLSAGSHTGAKGPVQNPWKRGYMAGGSSSGSAALVAAGEVDMAIAGDQGGSIRIPSANCGVYGMKATHGLVPYSGIMPIERTIDHVGPVTSTVADNALLLEVLAGDDGLDPRQRNPETARYTEALGQGVRGLRIGVLKEGFGRPESEPDVDRKVREAADRFRDLGASVQEVSVPEHFLALDCWTAIAVEGLQDQMMHGNAAGTNCRGLFLPSMIDHMAQWRTRADELSHSLRVCMFLGEHFRQQYRGRFYGKAQNLMRKANAAYAGALEAHDLLLLPTLPMKAQEIPPPGCSIALYIQRAFENIGNTAPFNGGLPAMNVPCGMSEGLPVGMMLVGAPHQETTIYRAAHTFEQTGDWRTM